MKKCLMSLALCLALLTACGAPAASSPAEAPPPEDGALSLAEYETPFYLACRIVDGT